MAGDQKMVITLLGAGADINEVGDSDGTPLYGAALSGSVSLIQTLIRRGADFNVSGPRGDYGYPLVAAAAQGHTAAVRALIRAGADFNPPIEGHRGVSPLEASIESRDAATFRAVLDADGNPNTPGRLYMNAFHAAIFTGELGMARILLERGAEVEDEGFLEAVSRYSRHPFFLEEILRTRKVDVNACRQKYYGSAMHIAINDGCEAAARLLLARKPYLDAVNDRGSILSAAIDRGMVHLAMEMIQLGADTQFCGENGSPFGLAIAQACDDGKIELMDLLLGKGADVNTGPGRA
jgi:ankyrin repeat protein